MNKLIPNLFLKASDDVKLSLILDCLPKLSVQKILKDLNDSEKEVTHWKDKLKRMGMHIFTDEKRESAKDDKELNVP